MEESRSRGRHPVFVDLYAKAAFYRGKRMTNWDPEAKTVLSNEEVIYHEENARLFHIKYATGRRPDAGHRHRYPTPRNHHGRRGGGRASRRRAIQAPGLANMC
jgi:isoleucyl-tRNA synthetase